MSIPASMDTGKVQILESQRLELLGLISNLECDPGTGMDRAQLDAVTKEYDNLIDRRNSAGEGLRRDPLVYFPPEIWLTCLHQLIDDAPNDLFTLLLVSREWQDILVSTPEMWTTVVVSNNIDAPQMIQAAFQLSHGQSLCLAVMLPFSPTETLIKQLGTERERIRNIVFHESKRSTYPSPSYHAIAGDFLSQLQPLPQLEIVETRYHEGIACFPMARNWLGSSSNIRMLPYWCIWSDDLDTSKKQLKTLTIHASLDVATDCLSHFPALEVLQVRRRPGEEENGKTFTKITNLCIRTLETYLFNSPRGHIIFSLRSLTSLQVTLDWMSLGGLFSNLETHSLLKALKLEIQDEENTAAAIPPVFPNLMNVRSFSFNVASSQEVIGPLIAELFSFLSRVMTGVHNLSVEFTTPSQLSLAPLLSYICLLQDLSSLVYLGHGTLEGASKVPLPSLQSFTVNSKEMMELIDAPNTHTIVVSGLDGPLKLDLTAKPQLDRLEVDIEQMQTLEQMSHSNLSVLSLLSSPMNEIGDHWDTISQNCLMLASLREIIVAQDVTSTIWVNIFTSIILDPTQLPKLETLSFGSYPTLCLLTRMLRNRNLYHRSTRSLTPITTIKLPGYPAPKFLRTLTRLLGQNTISKSENGGPNWPEYAKYYDEHR